MRLDNFKLLYSEGRQALPYWPALAMFLFLSTLTFYGINNTLWQTSQNAHGPIVLAVCIWFLLFKTSILIEEKQFNPKPSVGAGLVVFLLGCALYVIGHSQTFYTIEVFSLICISSGLVVSFLGMSIYKKLWFGFFFMLFLIPLPGSIIDAVTLPLKIAVSFATEHILYYLDYPIARNGVLLSIGQYQLLVADACSGMNSLFTLEALGLLYLNVMRYESFSRNLTLAIMIAPISYVANVTRVITLCLITYYYGDSAGQGFMHEFSGMVLFLSALVLIIMLDSFLDKAFFKSNKGAK